MPYSSSLSFRSSSFSSSSSFRSSSYSGFKSSGFSAPKSYSAPKSFSGMKFKSYTSAPKVAKQSSYGYVKSHPAAPKTTPVPSHVPVVQNHYYGSPGIGGYDFWFWMYILDRNDQPAMQQSHTSSTTAQPAPVPGQVKALYAFEATTVILAIALIATIIWKKATGR